ncbi:MAG TPA: 2-oxoacid:ferredoxin oxidoreductase subunit beta [Candidatus Eisenbacteria bacterium]|nr:2-oxoacid:ferredoxin oxidoreductase subunit beta [Candidatus Eisenbacteria bacterium]
MSATTKNPAPGGAGQPASPAKNRIGLTAADYKGSKSTLCPGCGHDAITNSIVAAAFEMGLDPHRLAKLSGIGCSSKTPAYFMSRSFAFNAVHGRMPSIATGVHVANRDLLLLGISGDGDTASIGIGQFIHLIRRNIPVAYLVENNGVYGLTKGQFSATADVGTKAKSGRVNEMMPIDLCALAIELGCGFVARSFSGDPKQLRPILKAALSHRGTAVVDILSPCVTFNNHEGSTKSYDNVKEHDAPLHDVSYVPAHEPIMVDYEPGETREVRLFDGSRVTLKKLDRDYDPSDGMRAMVTLRQARDEGRFVTGIVYADPAKPSFDREVDMVDRPLSSLGLDEVRPDRKVLEEIMTSLRTGAGAPAAAGGG